VPLSAEEQHHAPERLRARDPAALTVTAEQALAWHRRQAEACVKEHDPAAALFHALHGNHFWPTPTACPVR
jgi:hypothetical protein